MNYAGRLCCHLKLFSIFYWTAVGAVTKVLRNNATVIMCMVDYYIVKLWVDLKERPAYTYLLLTWKTK